VLLSSAGNERNNYYIIKVAKIFNFQIPIVWDCFSKENTGVLQL
jgi:hypothetical protein